MWTIQTRMNCPECQQCCYSSSFLETETVKLVLGLTIQDNAPRCHLNIPEKDSRTPRGFSSEFLVFSWFSYFGFGATTGNAQGLLLILCSVSLMVGLGRLYEAWAKL